MKLTAVIQADNGPIKIVTTTLARIERDLANWQHGSMATLRLRALHTDATIQALEAAWPYRTQGDWFGGGCLQIVLDALIFGGMPDIAQAIDDRHQALHKQQIAATDKARDKAVADAGRARITEIAGRR